MPQRVPAYPGRDPLGDAHPALREPSRRLRRTAERVGEDRGIGWRLARSERHAKLEGAPPVLPPRFDRKGKLVTERAVVHRQACSSFGHARERPADRAVKASVQSQLATSIAPPQLNQPRAAAVCIQLRQACSLGRVHRIPRSSPTWPR